MSTYHSHETAPSFIECVWACWDDPALMHEYRRLTGYALGEDRRSAIERMIDAASGYEPPRVDENEAKAFLEFVRDVVWSPLLNRTVGGQP